MSKVEIVKGSVGLVVSVGVGAIVGNVISATTPANTHIVKKVCIGVGTYVVSSMVIDKAVDYAEEQIDKIVNAVKGTVSKK